MTDEIEIVIPGPPPAKNERDRVSVINGKPARHLTKRFRAFVSETEAAWLKLRRPKIEAGTWACEIVAYQPQRSRKFDGPHADVDAPISCVLDALQRAGVIDDDMRIIRLQAAKAHDKDSPRVWVRLERLR